MTHIIQVTPEVKGPNRSLNKIYYDTKVDRCKIMDGHHEGGNTTNNSSLKVIFNPLISFLYELFISNPPIHLLVSTITPNHVQSPSLHQS